MTYNYMLAITGNEDTQIQVKNPKQALLILRSICDYYQIDEDDIECVFDDSDDFYKGKGLVWGENPEENTPDVVITMIRCDGDTDEPKHNNLYGFSDSDNTITFFPSLEELTDHLRSKEIIGNKDTVGDLTEVEAFNYLNSKSYNRRILLLPMLDEDFYRDVLEEPEEYEYEEENEEKQEPKKQTKH